MVSRLTILFSLLIVSFLVVAGRLFYWQVWSSEVLQGMAQSQTNTSFSLPAKRGRILASDGSPLVMNQRAFLVYVEPQKIKNTNEMSSLLAKELDIPVSTVSAKLANNSLLWVPIAHKVEDERMEKIKKANLPGIGFLEEAKRFYPESSMAAHILGFVGKNGKGEDQGYFGLEGYYDQQLKGREGLYRLEKDAKGNPILTGNREEIPAEDGRDLYLTLDKTVQFIVEQKLKEGLEEYGAKGGTVIVMDPTTGGILAMASYPSYHPGNFAQYPGEFYKNPAIASSYEPGSTFKVLVMGAAFNENKVKPETKYNEEGPIQIGEFAIKTWDQKYHGEITLTEVLEHSSNVGMVFVGRELGSENLLAYIEQLGFGGLTEVDLEEEASPILRSRKKWTEIDYATASFGQGIAVTPLQMVRAVAAIANGGNLVRPYLVKSIRVNESKMFDTKPHVKKGIFRSEIAAQVGEMMAAAVENGEARYFKPKGFRIAGKTGTAQIPIQGHYDTEKTIASFVGFAPLRKPKFVMLVTVNEPTSSPWGSETAAPLFFAIAKELFTYYGISPSD